MLLQYADILPRTCEPGSGSPNKAKRTLPTSDSTFLISYGNNRAADFVGGVKLFGDDS
jgi:hypothetical protein